MRKLIEKLYKWFENVINFKEKSPFLRIYKAKFREFLQNNP